MFATAEGKQVYDAEWELVCRKDSATANVSKTTTSSLTARSGKRATREILYLDEKRRREKWRKTERRVYWRWRNRLEQAWLRFYRRRRSFSIQPWHRENCFSNLELELEVVAVVALNKGRRMSFDANLANVKEDFEFEEGENFLKFSLTLRGSLRTI